MGYRQQALKLGNALISDVTPGMGFFCVLKQARGFFVVGRGNIQGMLKGGVVFNALFGFHPPSVAPLAG